MVVEKFVKEEQEQQQQQRLNQTFTVQNNIIVGNSPSHEVETTDISKLLLDTLNKSPDFVAQIDVRTGEKVTFAQIKDRTVRCALWLQKQGIGKGDIVCISTPNQTDDYVPALATFYVGAIYNPWYHELTPAISRYFFELIQPKIMFAFEQSIDMLVQAAKDSNVDCKFVVYGRHSRYPSLKDILSEQTQMEVDSFRHVEIKDPLKQPGVIFFSSGTTGTQKGTILSYDTLVNHRMEYVHLREKMNVLWYSSLSWIMGTNFVTTCIRFRATRILHDEFHLEETAKVIEQYKVNWTSLTPSMITQMCKAKIFSNYDFSSMKYILCGGSKPCKTILEEAQRCLPNAIVINSYGMTELGGLATINTKNGKRIDSIGFIVKGIKMKIVDPITGQVLGPNESGELCFSLRNVMLGYYKSPTETNKMIDKEGWLHTGDRGYYDEDGEIMITDRLKEVIITQNHHVSPSQIEEILLRHPHIKDVAVVAVPHAVDVERPFAFVVKAPGATITEEEVKELPTSFNQYFRLSGGVVFVDHLEYNSTGKKYIKKMKEMVKAYAR